MIRSSLNALLPQNVTITLTMVYLYNIFFDTSITAIEEENETFLVLIVTRTGGSGQARVPHQLVIALVVRDGKRIYTFDRLIFRSAIL